jgi:hypothetical protein
MVDVTGTAGYSVGSEPTSFLLELMQPKGPHGREAGGSQSRVLDGRVIAGGRSGHSLQQSVHTIAASLQPDEVAWLMPSALARPWLRTALARAGLEVKGTYVHFLDSTALKAIVPVGLLRSPEVAGMTGRHVRFRRFAACCLRVPGALSILEALYPTVYYAIGRPGGPVPAQWLFRAADIPMDRSAVLLRRSWHAPGSAIAYLFQKQDHLAAVAKIPGTAEAHARVERERNLLAGIAARAAGWGAEIPLVLCSGQASGVVFTGAMDGELAAGVLERRAAEFGPLAQRLTTWLAGWNCSTRAEPMPGRISRRLAEAASVLEPHLAGSREYFEGLKELVAREWQGIPAVASHGDLTMWNVMTTGSGLGILDWEEAEPDGVPLTDLYYALVDAAAACDSYRDRVAAFDACFFGARRREIQMLTAQAAGALRLKAPAVEICFHLCWLRHAANEIVREHPAAFVEIARRLVRKGMGVAGRE